MQEHLSMQLIRQVADIFREANLDLPLAVYSILPISASAGFIEFIPDALSLDELRQHSTWSSLGEFFLDAYGPLDSDRFVAAQRNFVRSTAAYSIVSYLLQVKDRHNANMLLAADGRICHIDFGFVFGKTVKFEKAPFKLTGDIVEVMTLGQHVDGTSEPIRMI
jgi:phosphatidylinositol kinase/protein kinase (PI-3  family)